MGGLCFTAIVRNEAAVIERCLNSVRPFISCWAIADTGSTDATRAVISSTLAGIPGVLRLDKWQDFATNRNLALRAARRQARHFGARYIITLDADEELVPEGELAQADFDQLTEDSYNAVFTRPDECTHWQRKLLMRSDQPWEYQGVVHEQPLCPGKKTGLVTGLHVVSHRDGNRAKDGERKKYLRDAKLLKQAVRVNPQDARSQFYLARTLASAGKLWPALEAYRKRIAMGPCANSEELFHSWYQVAAIREMLGFHWQDIAAAYLEAANDRPWRAEPWWALAVLYHQAGMLGVAELYARRAAALPYPNQDGLFVQKTVYEWRAADELACILSKVGRLEEARRVLERLSQRPQLPAEERERVAANIQAIKQREAA